MRTSTTFSTLFWIYDACAVKNQAGVYARVTILIITSDGLVYSYIMKYAEKLSKLNYFITEQESIENEKPDSKVSKKEKKVLYTLVTIATTNVIVKIVPPQVKI